jgi:redox-sensitive bicupin YhaK (pirin superfamily)
MLTVRHAAERGHANLGWLDSWHSFSFADYHDPAHMNFGPLRVINEDRIEPGQGFGTHGHRDMEIITYVLDGQLEHKDSMGNGSIMSYGEVQRMSAGHGVQHSEFNPSKSAPVHLLQVWIQPSITGVEPGYEQKRFEAMDKRGRLRLIASPDGEHGSVTIHQDARVYAGLFDGAETAGLELGARRRAYVHVARGTATVNGTQLGAGDAARVEDEDAIRIAGGRAAEVLVFDLP